MPIKNNSPAKTGLNHMFICESMVLSNIDLVTVTNTVSVALFPHKSTTINVNSYTLGNNPSTQRMMELIKEVASKFPHQEKTITYQDSIELIAIMHLKYNLRLIQIFLDNKEKEILHPM